MAYLKSKFSEEIVFVKHKHENGESKYAVSHEIGSAICTAKDSKAVGTNKILVELLKLLTIIIVHSSKNI